MRKDVCEYVGVDVHARECKGESEQAKDKEREEKRKWAYLEWEEQNGVFVFV